MDIQDKRNLKPQSVCGATHVKRILFAGEREIERGRERKSESSDVNYSSLKQDKRTRKKYGKNRINYFKSGYKI